MTAHRNTHIYEGELSPARTVVASHKVEVTTTLRPGSSELRWPAINQAVAGRNVMAMPFMQ